MKFLKDFKRFLTDVAHDPRIPESDKKVLLAMIILIVSPLDIIPDWIPLFGLLDDFVIGCLIVDYFFSVLDHQVILAHYPWGMKSFSSFRKFSKFFSYFVPGFIKKRIWQYTPPPY